MEMKMQVKAKATYAAEGHPGGMTREVKIDLRDLMAELHGDTLTMNVPMLAMHEPPLNPEFCRRLEDMGMSAGEIETAIEELLEGIDGLLLTKELKRRIVR
jgi:hypothetical protein